MLWGNHPTPSAVAFLQKKLEFHRAGLVSAPCSEHTPRPLAHLPACAFSLRIIKEHTPLWLGEIYSSLSEGCRCSS